MTNEEIKYDTQFKPFQRVLVRDDNDEIWRAQLFSHYQTESRLGYYYVTGAAAYKQCIPYEGNEELSGTAKNPKSKRWRANYNKTYYYVTKKLEVLQDVDLNDPTSIKLYEIGNYFKTKVAAELVAEKIRKLLNDDKEE